jgi:hypothetical protein
VLIYFKATTLTETTAKKKFFFVKFLFYFSNFSGSEIKRRAGPIKSSIKCLVMVKQPQPDAAVQELFSVLPLSQMSVVKNLFGVFKEYITSYNYTFFKDFKAFIIKAEAILY